MGDSIGLNAAVRAVNADARRGIAAHPGVDALLAYHAGELAEDEAEDLRDHLAVCRECARTVLDLASFPDVAPRDPERAPSDSQLADEVAAVRARIAEIDLPIAEVVPLRSPQKPALRQPAWLIAAVLAAAVVGLSYWTYALRGSFAALQREVAEPRLNTWTVSLTEERGGTPGKTIRFAEDQDDSTLILNYFGPHRELEDYAAEIVEPNGELVWSSTGLRPNPEIGNFSLSLHRDFLPAGEYRFVVYGIGIGKEAREQLASYLVRIEYD
jgi:hypothetical protein